MEFKFILIDNEFYSISFNLQRVHYTKDEYRMFCSTLPMEYRLMFNAVPEYVLPNHRLCRLKIPFIDLCRSDEIYTYICCDTKMLFQNVTSGGECIRTCLRNGCHTILLDGEYLCEDHMNIHHTCVEKSCNDLTVHPVHSYCQFHEDQRAWIAETAWFFYPSSTMKTHESSFTKEYEKQWYSIQVDKQNALSKCPDTFVEHQSHCVLRDDLVLVLEHYNKNGKVKTYVREVQHEITDEALESDMNYLSRRLLEEARVKIIQTMGSKVEKYLVYDDDLDIIDLMELKSAKNFNRKRKHTQLENDETLSVMNETDLHIREIVNMYQPFVWFSRFWGQSSKDHSVALFGLLTKLALLIQMPRFMLDSVLKIMRFSETELKGFQLNPYVLKNAACILNSLETNDILRCLHFNTVDFRHQVWVISLLNKTGFTDLKGQWYSTKTLNQLPNVIRDWCTNGKSFYKKAVRQLFVACGSFEWLYSYGLKQQFHRDDLLQYYLNVFIKKQRRLSY